LTVTVELVDVPPGNVEFDPHTAFSEDARLSIALEMKRIAHRLEDEMLAAYFRDLDQ